MTNVKFPMTKVEYSLVRHDVLDGDGNPTDVLLDKDLHEPFVFLNMLPSGKHSSFLAVVDCLIWTLRKYDTQEIIDGGFSLDLPITKTQKIYLGLVNDRVHMLSHPYPYFAVEVGGDRGVRYFLKDEEQWIYCLMAMQICNSLEGNAPSASYKDFASFISSDERVAKATLDPLSTAVESGHVEVFNTDSSYLVDYFGRSTPMLHFNPNLIPEWAIIKMHANPILSKSWVPKSSARRRLSS